jgi:hypothetical protein
MSLGHGRDRGRDYAMIRPSRALPSAALQPRKTGASDNPPDGKRRPVPLPARSLARNQVTASHHARAARKRHGNTGISPLPAAGTPWAEAGQKESLHLLASLQYSLALLYTNTKYALTVINPLSTGTYLDTPRALS